MGSGADEEEVTVHTTTTSNETKTVIKFMF
jgi:hypothetical protein